MASDGKTWTMTRRKGVRFLDFFQAEDGIRDIGVTGVQTCALPIYEFAVALSLTSRETATVPVAIARFAQQYEVHHSQMAAASVISTIPAILLMFLGQRFEIGRASCRERV